jgi:hypothetical protein
MKQKEFVYDLLAGFLIGSNVDTRGRIKLSKEDPQAVCFFVPSKKDYRLEKLFDNYVLFSKDSIDSGRKMFSLISHLETPRTLLHGGLTVNGDKNILFLGNRASGKSTLTLNLGNPIDDDTLVYHEGKLYVPSLKGYTAEGRSPNKTLKIASINPEPKKPDVIFLLDKKHEGGYIKETDEIPLEYYLPNYFNRENTEQYIKHNNFSKPKDVPMFVLGTNGGLEKTLEVAQKVFC